MRKPDEKPESDEQYDHSEGIESCAKELIRAVQANDPKAVANALEDAFAILESKPHEEGPHTNDYHSQNIKAAQQENE